jgi:group I intron endonuclease
MPKSGIYRIDFPNGKFYYGQSQSVRARKYAHMSHLRRGRHGNPIMQACWDKYGEMTFTEVLRVPVDRLDEVEQSYLNVFVDMKDCVNIARDASAPARGLRMSAETRRKMSEAKKGVPLSQEHRRKIRESKKGHTPSQETRRKISEAQMGLKLSKATRASMRAAQRANTPVLKWTHPEHGDVDAPRWEMLERWPELNGGNLSSVQSGKRAHHKGWRKRDG